MPIMWTCGLIASLASGVPTYGDGGVQAGDYGNFAASEGGKVNEEFTRVISALIPRLLARLPELKRVWASNFNHSLRCTLWTMLP